jgi:hypothetical protein
MHIERNVQWIIGLGVTCLVLFILLSFSMRHDGKSTPIASPTPVGGDSLDDQKNRLTQSAPSPEPGEPLPKSLVPPREIPPTDEHALEFHRMMAEGLNAKLREATKRLYAAAFQQLHLPPDLQEKVIDILVQQQMQFEQKAFEAAQSGTLPALPSPAEARAEQAQQDQQLHSVLGDADFDQFNQYRATIPDRTMIDAMNQQGASLTESQSQQLLQVLTDARQQVIGRTGMTQNFDSMSPEQTMTVMREQQSLLQQTVGNRVQNILTPDQVKILQATFSEFSLGPKSQ